MRESYVDIAKGLAIIGVLTCHLPCSFINEELFHFPGLLSWNTFVVPVFFFIAGFYLKEEKVLQTKSFLIGKTKRLWLVAMITYIPVVLLHNVLFDIGWYSSDISYGGKMIDYWDGEWPLVKNVLTTLLCAGREPILGTMWFIFVLFFGMIVYAMVSKIIKYFISDRSLYYGAKLLTFSFMCFGSFVATKFFGLTLNRFSNTLSILLLIYLGYIFKQVKQIQFNNLYVAFFCLLIGYGFVITSGVGLNNNIFENPGQLVFGTLCISYFFLYFGRLIEKTWLGKVLALCGHESLYIMMWQFIAFKTVDYLLMAFGAEYNLAALSKNCGNNIVLWAVYMIAGLGLPIAFITGFRKARNVIYAKVAG